MLQGVWIWSDLLFHSWDSDRISQSRDPISQSSYNWSLKWDLRDYCIRVLLHSIHLDLTVCTISSINRRCHKRPSASPQHHQSPATRPWPFSEHESVKCCWHSGTPYPSCSLVLWSSFIICACMWVIRWPTQSRRLTFCQDNFIATKKADMQQWDPKLSDQ